MLQVSLPPELHEYVPSKQFRCPSVKVTRAKPGSKQAMQDEIPFARASKPISTTCRRPPQVSKGTSCHCRGAQYHPGKKGEGTFGLARDESHQAIIVKHLLHHYNSSVIPRKASRHEIGVPHDPRLTSNPEDCCPASALRFEPLLKSQIVSRPWSSVLRRITQLLLRAKAT